MKARRITLSLLLLFTIISCKQDSYSGEFANSYNAWLKFKSKSQNFYSYTVTTSPFTGASTETTIEIFNGVIYSRTFKAVRPDPAAPGSIILLEEWSENREQLNTHQNGAAAKTLDEIYNEIKGNWIVKKAGAQTFFETKNEGMVSLAGYVEDGCQDDCFRGIRIGAINDLLYRVHFAPKK